MREEKYMDYDIEMNKKDYQREKEARAKRLEAYAEAIQTITLQKSSKVIEELIEERRRQGLTQQDLADMTGILAPNLARLESRKRVPTLVVLQKYASALGMHIEVKLCDGTEEEGFSTFIFFRYYIRSFRPRLTFPDKIRIIPHSFGSFTAEIIIYTPLHQGIIFQCQVSMSKASWYIHLLPVFKRQHRTVCVTEGFSWAQIHSHIENR